MKQLFPATLATALLAVSAAATLGCGANRYSSKEALSAAPAAMPAPDGAAEEYDRIPENQNVSVAKQPVSTFSIDVDTASYSNVRRMLRSGKLPPADAVRAEELINYFSYAYPQPRGEAPFSVITEVAASPWNPDRQLVHIGLQGKRIDADKTPRRNLVFLLDVSGSMGSADKLPLLIRAFKLLSSQLEERDRVSIVVYAGASGVVLEPTSGSQHRDIMEALSRLRAGGSTNGGAGIQMAYQLAEQNFEAGAINRVILATDGDFNVGVSDRASLIRLVEEKRKSGVYLTVLGFGSGNLKDSTMEQLADKGNGNYAYIDNYAEARKVLAEQIGSTLITIAEDVKVQVAFNREAVKSYRLIGYENRVLNNRDFNDDSKDAGDIGAGHTVTALYEIVPATAGDGKTIAKGADSAPIAIAADTVKADALLDVKLRYKDPGAADSKLIQLSVARTVTTDPSESFRLSAAIAEFAMLLRNSEYSGEATWASAAALARGATGSDPSGRRAELVKLIELAAKLSGGESKAIAK